MVIITGTEVVSLLGNNPPVRFELLKLLKPEKKHWCVRVELSGGDLKHLYTNFMHSKLQEQEYITQDLLQIACDFWQVPDTPVNIKTDEAYELDEIEDTDYDVMSFTLDNQLSNVCVKHLWPEK
jgi:hypothetical protein